jgi:type VI secretion system secreted protein VgrG
MPGPAIAHQFRLDIAPLFLGLQVLSFTGKEAISAPFAFELEVLIDEPLADMQALMYRSAFLAFKGKGTGIHGQIHSVMRRHFKPGPASYQLSIGPRLTCLGQRYTPRVFQQMNAPEIIALLLFEHGIKDDSHQFDLKADYQTRDFCAQHRESDLQLVQRLCAEEGIHYHFQHSRKGHHLVFGDGLRVFRRMPVAVMHEMPALAGVSRFLVAQAGDEQGRQRGVGQSTLPFVSSGHLLPLMGHPVESLNHLWLVTEVVHRGFDTRQLRSVTGNETAAYSNEFHVTPWEFGFKPTPQPRPSAPNVHCAYVVGALGEPVRLDEKRRVNIQLDWGYHGQGAAYGNCWVPVEPDIEASLRGGMQVVVRYEDENMDKPIVSARVWRPADVLPEPVQSPSPRDLMDVHLGQTTVMEAEPFVQIEGGSRIAYQEGCELSFTVGDSSISIDATGLRLRSPQVQLTAGCVTADREPEH